MYWELQIKGYDCGRNLKHVIGLDKEQSEEIDFKMENLARNLKSRMKAQKLMKCI